MKTTKYITLNLILVILFCGCEKNNDVTTNPPGINPIELPGSTTPVLIKKIEGILYADDGVGNSSVPVINAQISCNGVVTRSNINGYFRFDNITVNEKTSFLTIVPQNQYFGNSKTLTTIKYFYPNENGNFLLIECVKAIITGNTVSSSNGGTFFPFPFTRTNIIIPQNGFNLKGTTTEFNGDLTLYYNFESVNNSFIANSDAASNGFSTNILYSNFTGSLDRAVSKSGELVSLTPFSNILNLNVEGDINKEEVSLKENKKIKVVMSSEPLSYTKNEIPSLWYFDKQNCIWIEGEEATVEINNFVKFFTANSSLNSNSYIFAKSSKVVSFQAKALNSLNNSPIANSLVRINKVGDKQNTVTTWTNSLGEIRCKVPSNTNLEISILNHYLSPNVFNDLTEDAIVKLNIGQLTSTTNLNTLLFSNPTTLNPNVFYGQSGLSNIRGKVIDCNNSPVSNATIRIQNVAQKLINIFQTDNNGSFNLSFVNVTNFPLFSDDNNGNSTPCIFLPYSDNLLTQVNYDSIKICNSNTQEYINLVIDGIQYNYTKPSSNFEYYKYRPGTIPIFPQNEGIKSINSSNPLFDFSFSGDSRIGVRSLLSMYFANYTNVVMSNYNVTITENLVNGSNYIAGSFNNVQVMHSNNTIHSYSGNFRVKTVN